MAKSVIISSGNGESGSPSNARTLDWGGNEWLAGNLIVNKTTLVNTASSATSINLPSSAGTLALLSDLPTDTNYYHTPDYSTGLKIATGTGVSDLYVPTGTTSSTVCAGNDSRLSDSRTPTSHTHGSITNDGKLDTASRIVVTDTNKNISVGSINPSDIVLTNDSRLSDARTPTSHSHGNILNDGTITSTAVTAATGALVYDSNNKIQRAAAADVRTIIGAGTYTKPSGGIPDADIASASTWNGKADTNQTYTRVYTEPSQLNLTAPTTVVAIVQAIISDNKEKSLFIRVNDNNNIVTDAPDSYGLLRIETGNNVVRPSVTYIKQIGTAGTYHCWIGNVLRSNTPAPNTVTGIEWHEVCDLNTAQTVSAAKYFQNASLNVQNTARAYTYYDASGTNNWDGKIPLRDVDGTAFANVGSGICKTFNALELGVLSKSGTYKNVRLTGWGNTTDTPTWYFSPGSDNDVILGNPDWRWQTVYATEYLLKDKTVAYSDSPTTALNQYISFIDKNNTGIADVHASVTSSENALSLVLRNKSNGVRNIKFSHSSNGWCMNPTTNNSVNLGTPLYMWKNVYGKTFYEDGVSLVNKYSLIPTLLWDASTSWSTVHPASWSGGNIAITTTGYKAFLIWYDNNWGDRPYCCSIIWNSSGTPQSIGSPFAYSDSAGAYGSRYCTVGVGKITFGKGYVSAVNNSACIPYQIYGLK